MILPRSSDPSYTNPATRERERIALHDFIVNLDLIDDEYNYHDIYDDADAYDEETKVECDDINKSDEVVIRDSKATMENEIDDEADSSTHSWKEMYDMDSLSDSDFSDGVISFNESFGTGMGAEFKKDSNASNVGEDWDAVSEIQTVISVNTFSGNKEMMFSYKDAYSMSIGNWPP